jgi:hypothetical protein
MKTTKRSVKMPQNGQVTEATSYGPPATGSVKSAGRVLRILEFFDEIQRDARVAEIAERLSFPQSSTSILLNCLVDLGYMDYLPESRTFLPSPRVTLLGTWLDKGPVRNGSLIRMLEEISQKTGDTVIVAARNGIFSQYIHVLQAQSAMRSIERYGISIEQMFALHRFYWNVDCEPVKQLVPICPRRL